MGITSGSRGHWLKAPGRAGPALAGYPRRVAAAGRGRASRDSCPTAKDEIATDRPDVTNSSLVVPTGSFQSENGINFSSRDGGRTLDGTNTRWRIGIAPCWEVLVDLPLYSANLKAQVLPDFPMQLRR